MAAERRAAQEANVKAKKDAKAAKGKGKSVRIEADGEEKDESPVEDDFAYEDAMLDGDAFDPLDVLDEVLEQPSDVEDEQDSEEDAEPAPPPKRVKSDAPKAKFSMKGRRPR